METINHECYVSLEVAKLLREVGFDWECRCYYETSGKLRGKNSGNFYNYNSPLLWQNNGNTDTQLYSAPTIEVAQRWLREMKDIWCEVTICFVMEDALMKTKYHVQCISTDYNNPEIIDCHNIETNTPEEALEAGIKKALEIILEKGE